MEENVHTEEEFLLDKTVRCNVCEYVFKTKMVKNGRVRRLSPDKDLRPRFQFIDTLKYNTTSCPQCGYTALNRFFDQITSVQRRFIREQICSQFHPAATEEEAAATYSYDMAIDRYKLALANTVVKRGKASEKAYTCLNLAWLLREKAASMPEGKPEEKAAKLQCLKEAEAFYEQAFEGFSKAISQEMFPMCGMDQSTVDYLLAYMAFHFKKYEIASKFLGSVMTSSSASRRLKDMAYELKESIIAQLRKPGAK